MSLALPINRLAPQSHSADDNDEQPLRPPTREPPRFFGDVPTSEEKEEETGVEASFRETKDTVEASQNHQVVAVPNEEEEEVYAPGVSWVQWMEQIRNTKRNKKRSLKEGRRQERPSISDPESDTITTVPRAGAFAVVPSGTSAPSVPSQSPVGDDAGCIAVAQLSPDENEIAERVQLEVRAQLENELKRQVTVTAVAIAEEKDKDSAWLTATWCGGVGRGSGGSRRTFYCLLIVLFLVLGGGVTGIILALLGGGDNNNVDAALAHSPSPFPSPSPTHYTTPQFDAMLERIGKDISDDTNVFKNRETFQYQALDWLANEDTWSSSGSSSNLPTQVLVERYALAVLYLSTQGPDWTDQYSFLSNALSVCQWRDPNTTGGVMCDENDVFVKQLHLANANVRGAIPSEMALLSSLEQLKLDQNKLLFGTIPTELFQMRTLLDFSIFNCSLEGTIPSRISELTNLKYLSLGENRFEGTISTELGALTGMIVFDMGDNMNLNGTIPTDLGLMTAMQGLYLEGNQFQGTLPTELGRLVNLVYLWVDRNRLTGTIPTEFANLVELKSAYLHFNDLEGSVNETFCTGDRNVPFETLWTECSGSNPKVICSCCTACCNDANVCVAAGGL